MKWLVGLFVTWLVGLVMIEAVAVHKEAKKLKRVKQEMKRNVIK